MPETTTELVSVRKFRKQVPEAHRGSADTRLLWLWNQRFGTIQTIYAHSTDLLDRTMASLLLQCALGKDLESIALVFRRLEGGPQVDEEVQEAQAMRV